MRDLEKEFVEMKNHMNYDYYFRNKSQTIRLLFKGDGLWGEFKYEDDEPLYAWYGQMNLESACNMALRLECLELVGSDYLNDDLDYTEFNYYKSANGRFLCHSHTVAIDEMDYEGFM